MIRLSAEARKNLEERLAALEKLIAEYPYWGAALSVMDEERREIQSTLNWDKKVRENG